MNPIWRMAHEMSKSRSETQKRNQRRREAAKAKTKRVKEQQRQDYLDRDRRRYMVGQENDGGVDTVEQQTEEESVAEKFQRELCWCIEQLEIGLSNPKATKIQRQESEKILKTLKSSKAPIPKKRQVMHATFGDYRTKMQNDKKKHAKEMEKCFITPAEGGKVEKGKFIRQSSLTAKQNTASLAVPNNVVVSKETSTELENSDHDNSCPSNNQVTDDTNSKVLQTDGKETRSNNNTDDSSENSMTKKPNLFRFDFKVDDEESKSEEEGVKNNTEEEKHELEKATEGSSKVQVEIHRGQTELSDDDDETTDKKAIDSQDNIKLQQGIENINIQAENN